MTIKTIFLGSDHRGFEKKEELQKYLEDRGYTVNDVGPFEYNPDDDYPEYAFKVAESVAKDGSSKGVLLCGSSIGVTIAANKVKGILASSPRTASEAKEDIEHHNSNVISLSADHLNFEEMKEVMDSWLSAEYQGGRHERRIQMIRDYENKR